MAFSSETIGDLVKARRWDDAKKILAEEPELAFWVDPSNSRTALHIMCRMDLVQNEANDPDCDVPGTCLPPHIELAQMLIDFSHDVDPVILPNAVRLDSNGEGGDEMYIMHMSVLTVKDYLGDTPLHHLCGNMRSSCPYLVQLILTSASDYAVASIEGDGLFKGNLGEEERYSRAPKTRDLLTAKNTNGCTALHFICEGSAPWDISKTIIDACRHTEVRSGTEIHPMLVQDDDGDSPLHFACSAGLEPRFLRHLIQAVEDKAIVHMANNDGRLPVDDLIVWFIDENDSDSEGDSTVPLLERTTAEMLTQLWERVEVLLQTTIDGSQRNEQSGTRAFRPLHATASMHTFPSFILRLACKLFPDELSATDETGLTALHVAASRQTCGPFTDPDAEMYAELARWKSDSEEDTMITFVSSLNPDSAQVLSNSGRLPLHLAIESRKSIGDIQHLLLLSPCSLETRDEKTRLQPFMLAAVGEDSSLDLLYFLLRRNPELVRSGIK